MSIDTTKFKQVYFRLNSPYEWGKGMDESLSSNFNSEAIEILTKLGFNIFNDGSGSFSCPQGVLNEQGLYMHPMSFSGVLSIEMIDKVKEVIAEAEKKSDFFSVREIDVYDIAKYSEEDIIRNIQKQCNFDSKKSF